MQEQIGNGSLKLRLKGRKYYTVWGGPYVGCPAEFVGVKLAPEINKSCDINLPIPDFGTPTKAELDMKLMSTVIALLDGMPVYAGCMAGRGRTGLFLSILAKAFGEPMPVEYVRKHYFEHAVETKGQYQFVMSYEIPSEVMQLIDDRRSFWNFRAWFKDSLTKKP